MPNLTIRRKSSKKQRALRAASKATSAAGKIVKARIAWLVGKRATRVAVPAVAVGTAAVVVKKRSGSHDDEAPGAATNAYPTAPASVA